MDSGISFDAACGATPQALTVEQRANCPGMQSTPNYMRIGLICVALALIVIGIIFIMRKKRTK